jgi:hypothetical protein
MAFYPSLRMPTLSIPKPLARGLTFAALAAAAASCKGLTEINAGLQNVTASDTVYALNGGPANAPNTLNLFQGVVLRADQGFGFDVAFDIDKDGKVVIIPSKALATTFSNPYSVGLQKAEGTFESVVSAPKDGYRADTATTIGVNQTIIVESRDVFNACLYAIKGQSYYSKIVVTEVDPVLRRMVFTVTVNRNCGFHSFAPGVPRE